MFKRLISVLAAAAMFCAGAVLVASPAQAATAQFRIFFVGSKIDTGIYSIKVDLLNGDVRCATGVVAGKDYDTGIIKNIPDGSKPGSDARKVRLTLFMSDHCKDSYKYGYYEAPQVAQSGVNRWWIEIF